MPDHQAAIYCAMIAGIFWEIANRIDKPSGIIIAVCLRAASFALMAVSLGYTLLAMIPLIN